MNLLIGAGIFVVILLVLVFLPTILSRVLDPINARRIRAYCESVGCSVAKIKPFPNHYGVSFVKNGRKGYAKCRISKGTIRWKGRSPEEF